MVHLEGTLRAAEDLNRLGDHEPQEAAGEPQREVQAEQAEHVPVYVQEVVCCLVISMLVHVIDADEELDLYPFFDRMEYGTYQMHLASFLDRCRLVFPTFDKPYLRLTREEITIAGHYGIVPVHGIFGDETQDDWQQIFQNFFKERAFGNLPERNVVNFGGASNDHIFASIVRQYDILRSTLPDPLDHL